MRQAIKTKYLGPTNCHGARISVSAQAGRKTYPWDYSRDVNDNHTRAAALYAQHWGWSGTWVGGASPDGTGNVYVHVRHKRLPVELSPDEAFYVAPEATSQTLARGANSRVQVGSAFHAAMAVPSESHDNGPRIDNGDGFSCPACGCWPTAEQGPACICDAPSATMAHAAKVRTAQPSD